MDCCDVLQVLEVSRYSEGEGAFLLPQLNQIVASAVKVVVVTPVMAAKVS